MSSFVMASAMARVDTMSSSRDTVFVGSSSAIRCSLSDSARTTVLTA